MILHERIMCVSYIYTWDSDGKPAFMKLRSKGREQRPLTFSMEFEPAGRSLRDFVDFMHSVYSLENFSRVSSTEGKD